MYVKFVFGIYVKDARISKISQLKININVLIRNAKHDDVTPFQRFPFPPEPAIETRRISQTHALDTRHRYKFSLLAWPEMCVCIVA